MKTQLFVAALCIALSTTSLFAQHTVQVDNGPNRVGLLDVSFLPVGVTLYSFPSVGGTLVTLGSGVANPWLLMGNALTNAGASPTQWIGTLTNDDVIMKANGAEKLRLSVSSGIVMSDNASILNQNQLRLMELGANGTDYVAFRAPASLAAPYVLTLPTTNGAAGQLLSNDGTGTLSWKAAGGSTTVNTAYTGAGSLVVSTNNLNIGTNASLYRIQNNSGGPVDLTGLDATGSVDGRIVIITNISSDVIVLRHNTGSTVGNRFYLPGGTDIILGQNGTATFAYDLSAQFWILISSN